MNMNSVNVHTFNKTPIAKQGQLLLAGVLMSSLLTACGASGPSAEETAARAAVTAAQSAATAAASAAQAAAAAVAAADKTAADKAAADAVAAAKKAAQAATEAAAKAVIDKAATDEAEQAKSAAIAAQASADKAAASAVLAAQAAADKAGAIAAARQAISTAVNNITKDVQAAQAARANAASVAEQTEQQAASYPELAGSASISDAKTYAAQAATETEKAVAEKTRVEKIQDDAAAMQDVAALQALVTDAKSAEQAAKAARQAAEKALDSTRAAASKVASEVAAANAARRYTKLDSAGNALPASATSWACVKENATGKVWESKTNSGLRDSDWRYRHFHNYAGYASTKDSNGRTLCEGLGNCDAYSYVNAVNGTGLCGRSQWRLPTMEELLNLVQVNDNGQRPNIDLKVFPDTVNKPNEAAYCSENLARKPSDCGANYTNPHYEADGRIECNYQGVDYGLPISADNPRGGSMVALRHYGEVQDGLPTYPANNWICYTRLISDN